MAGLGKGVGGGLLKFAANFTGVSVADIRTLYHQDVSDAANRIHPGLSAPGTAMAEGAAGKHGRHARVRSAENACPNAPAIIGAVADELRRLEETRRQVAGLNGR